MKPKVYVLSSESVDENYIVGIYSSNKAAEERRQKMLETVAYYKYFPDELKIEEFILDEKGAD